MKRSLLIVYQFLIGLLDTSTGVLLLFAPTLALRLMRIRAPNEALVFISYLGVFVLSVGLSCLYGGQLVIRHTASQKLEVVWLLTGMTRMLVAIFVVVKVTSGAVEVGWSPVAFTDGAFALFQFTGLARGWLRNVSQ